jgi:hypothetical protein
VTAPYDLGPHVHIRPPAPADRPQESKADAYAVWSKTDAAASGLGLADEHYGRVTDDFYSQPNPLYPGLVITDRLIWLLRSTSFCPPHPADYYEPCVSVSLIDATTGQDLLGITAPEQWLPK